MARTVEQFEFTPEDTSRVEDRMARLSEARDGWINLLPGVPESEVREAPHQGPLAGLFGPKTPGVTMVTWMPPSGGRRSREHETLGVMHPIVNRAARVLAQSGVPVPDGWRVRQDHARRGMVLWVAIGTTHADVVGWALRAATALCAEPMTGKWRADVYLPRGATAPPS